MRPDEHKKKASRAWNRAHPEGRGGSRGRGRGRGVSSPGNGQQQQSSKEEPIAGLDDYQDEADEDQGTKCRSLVRGVEWRYI